MPSSSPIGKPFTAHHVREIEKRLGRPLRILDVGPGDGTYWSLLHSWLHKDTVWDAVEIFEPYVAKFNLHAKYRQVRVEDVRSWAANAFPHAAPDEYDVCFCGDVLEHMEEQQALDLLEHLKQFCSYVIVSIPINEMKQDEVEDNPYEKHLSLWTHEKVLQWFEQPWTYHVEHYMGVYIYAEDPPTRRYPARFDSLRAGRPHIAVYAICKNEEKYVARFMDMAKEADAVYVLDTGSTDGTAERLNELGARVKVQEFKPWRFDVARNASLAMVPETVEIAACIDLDEVLSPGWAEELRKLWVANPGITRPRYPFNWSHKENGDGAVTYNADKIHARIGYKWVGPVHETLKLTMPESHPEKPVWTDAFHIHHWPDSGKPRSQYLPLLELAVKEDPENDRQSHYLGREYMYQGRWEDAITELKRHLSLESAKWDAERSASMRYIASCNIKLKRNAEAMCWLLRAIAEAPTYREAWVDLAMMAHGAKHWETVLWASRAALGIEEKPPVYVCRPEAWGDLPHDLAAMACWWLGMHEEGLEHARDALALNPDDPRLQKNVVEMEKVIESKAG